MSTKKTSKTNAPAAKGPAGVEQMHKAVALHQSGRLDEAEKMYYDILRAEPQVADALHLLGLVYFGRNQLEDCVDLITSALLVNPGNPDAHANLGKALLDLGRFEEAEAAYRTSLELRPNHAETFNNLGNALKGMARHEDALACYRKSLEIDPGYAPAHNNIGNVLKDLRKFDQAIAHYHKAIELRPDYAIAYNNLGFALQDDGRHEEAIHCFRKALELNPEYVEAYNNLGNALRQLNRNDEAVTCFRKALDLRPDVAEAYFNLGLSLAALGRQKEALACFRSVIELRPEFAEASYQLGAILCQDGRYEDALMHFKRALELQPDYVEAHLGMGQAFKASKRYDEAIGSYRDALGLRPGDAEICNYLGNVLQDAKRYEEAVACYCDALEFDPGYVEAYNNVGSALKELKKYDEAVGCFQKAIELQPDFAQAYSNLGNALAELKRHDEAVEFYRRALELQPGFAGAYYNLGLSLQEKGEFPEAIRCYRRTLESQPDHPLAFGTLADAELKICDWNATRQLGAELIAHVGAADAVVSPFTLLCFGGSGSDLLSCAKQYVHEKLPQLPAPLWNGEQYRHERIRLAYLSADFHQHATAYLMAELFELHDKNRFELIGISFGPDDQSPIRARIEAAFDQFFDAGANTDAEIAQVLRELEIDIAIDLKGFTQNARIGILAHRPAPVQVNYLGYPGTMGADFIDYLIADQWTAPFDQQPCFSERIVHLPDCYQVNDRKRAIAPEIPQRAACGLPEDGFVFCCFNNNYKITPEVFDIWTRLLHRIPGSVLWLLSDNAAAEANLRKEAQARGIDARRLVFAPRMPLENHLARQRLADLFLDTLPVNAHTTASDALWAGLPLLTCVGKTFAGRVAASLLHAVGLPELVAGSLEQYEAIALQLASDPQRLSHLRGRLAKNRLTSPLFDTERSTRHLETAYQVMHQAGQRGEPPKSFAVEPA